MCRLAARCAPELVSLDGAPYWTAITHLLAAHEPYPAMVLDRRYTVLLAIQACDTLFGRGGTGSNFVTDALANPPPHRRSSAGPKCPGPAWTGSGRTPGAHRSTTPPM